MKMGLYLFKCFDWHSFNKHLTTPDYALAPAIVKKVSQDRTINPNAWEDFPKSLTYLSRWISESVTRDVWYDEGHEESFPVIDQLIGLIFSEPVCQLLSCQPCGNGVDAFVIDYAAGKLDVVISPDGKNRFRKAEFSTAPMSILGQIGERPYRFPAWEPASEDVNPFFESGVIYFPNYSIHAPEEVVQLSLMARDVDLSKITEESLCCNYLTDFLNPFAEVANKGFAMYAFQDL